MLAATDSPISSRYLAGISVSSKENLFQRGRSWIRDILWQCFHEPGTIPMAA